MSAFWRWLLGRGDQYVSARSVREALRRQEQERQGREWRAVVPSRRVWPCEVLPFSVSATRYTHEVERNRA